MDCPEVCAVKMILEYQRRKPEKSRDKDCWFFLGVSHFARQNPELHPVWFTPIQMGRNTLQKLLKEAMKKTGVDVTSEKITATSSRKQMIQAS